MATKKFRWGAERYVNRDDTIAGVEGFIYNELENADYNLRNVKYGEAVYLVRVDVTLVKFCVKCREEIKDERLPGQTELCHDCGDYCDDPNCTKEKCAAASQSCAKTANAARSAEYFADHDKKE